MLLAAAAAAAACGRRPDESAESMPSRPDPGPEMRFFDTNGIRVRAAVQGTGPLVILVHGWPELWYSWRHQLPALAAAGYRAVAPDVRGYGGSDKPVPVEAYTMVAMTGDVIGLIDALGEEQAILVGHDWGAPIVWNTAALHPHRVAAVAGLSVPYFQRGAVPPIALWRQLYEDRFFYQLYFQEPGVAETEFAANMREGLRKVYYMASGDASPEVVAAMTAKTPDSNLLDGLPNPDPFPDWLTEADIDYFTAAFEQGGMRGPLNRYRAQNLDWELLPQLSELTVDQPSCFIAGERDPVRGMVPGFDMYAAPEAFCTDFRGSTIIEGEGHWIQQEAPDAVNAALLAFLRDLD